MPANPFELRADVRPLDAAAARWTDVGALVSRRGDELVEAALRATEGWDAAAAESYEQHRRQVLANLDRFTALALQVSASLRAISSILTSSQAELDRAWAKVALVPHEVVGESRHLVFRPDDDEGRGKVSASQAETADVRRRLALSLDQESARLRAARAELGTVRTELTTLTGGVFGPAIGSGILPGAGSGVGPGFGPGSDAGFAITGELSGVGTAPSATSVPGSAQSGVTAAGLAPVAPISVDLPHLSGLSAAALAPSVATAGAFARSRRTRSSADGTAPPVGGMGMGAMGARAGTMSRGMASGRAGARRLATPRLEGEDDAAAAARAKQAEREAKRAALEEKRAERAARKAERDRERGERDRERDRERDDRGGVDEPLGRSGAPEAGETGETGETGERPAAIRVVHYEPGDEPATDDGRDGLVT